jgi:hypothetical protein
MFCPVCKVVIERDETVRGYEVTKGQYLKVEDAELEALEAEANSSIDLREFIPMQFRLSPRRRSDIAVKTRKIPLLGLSRIPGGMLR